MGRREVPHKVTFRHCPVSGTWVLIIDGEHKGTGSEAIYNRKFFVNFKINPEDEGVIK